MSSSGRWVRGAAAILLLLAVLAVAPDPVGAQRRELYRPPVDATVVDPFRPPAEPWLAGNRGLEYDTAPGTPVRAIGHGLVVFAGPVAGHLYVTVLHGDGIRSSYSYLASISVSDGDRVRGGQVVGFTGTVNFHLGARIGSTYIDPASLFGTPVGQASVFLVPLGGGDGEQAAALRATPLSSAGLPVAVTASGDEGSGGSGGTVAVSGRSAVGDRPLGVHPAVVERSAERGARGPPRRGSLVV